MSSVPSGLFVTHLVFPLGRGEHVCPSRNSRTLFESFSLAREANDFRKL